MVKNPQIYESFLLSIIEDYFLPLSLLDTPFQFSMVQNLRNMIPFLTVLFSYPPPSLYIHTFRTFYLPWKTVTSNIDIIPAPLIPAANIDTSPLPTCYLPSLSIFLSYAKENFLIAFLFPHFLLISFFFFYLILSPESFFVPFSFSLLPSKKGNEDFLIFEGNLGL